MVSDFIKKFRQLVRNRSLIYKKAFSPTFLFLNDEKSIHRVARRGMSWMSHDLLSSTEMLLRLWIIYISQFLKTSKGVI